MRYRYFFILSFLTVQVFSQDTIDKRNDYMIPARIQESVADERTNKFSEYPDGSTTMIEKSRSIKNHFQDGGSEIHAGIKKDPERYAGQRRNGLKVNVLSPLFGYTQLGYERSLKPGRSLEINLGIIGMGINYDLERKCFSCKKVFDTLSNPSLHRDAKGVNFGIGYKFIRKADYKKSDIPFAHQLQGSYLKPVLYAGVYEENIINHKNQPPFAEARTVEYGALMFELGKQTIYSERFMLDLFLGFGFCFDNIQHEDYTYSNFSTENQAWHFNTFRVGSFAGFALNGGIKMGVLLGKTKE